MKFFGLGENRYNYPSPRRALRNAPNPPTQVRPDALANFTIFWRDQPTGSAHIEQLENTFGVEVKAYNGTLDLSSNDYQILGELEMLRNNFDQLMLNPYWQQLTDPPFNINTFTNGPVLLFITTDDTEIGQSIINEAANLKISIWQTKAIYDAGTNKTSFGPLKFVYDKANINAKGTDVPIEFVKAVIRGSAGLEVPLTLLTPIQPNFDLDPDELKN